MLREHRSNWTEVCACTLKKFPSCKFRYSRKGKGGPYFIVVICEGTTGLPQVFPSALCVDRNSLKATKASATSLKKLSNVTDTMC